MYLNSTLILEIIKETSNTGIYNWSVWQGDNYHNQSSSYYRIKIEDLGNVKYYDFSPNFTITNEKGKIKMKIKTLKNNINLLQIRSSGKKLDVKTIQKQVNMTYSTIKAALKKWSNSQFLEKITKKDNVRGGKICE
ncbi:hypothetical protein LCGC14_1274560 [marine sediment metagenome]|uniref:Uncharacterized protein n=1 Tax=marine sediment metagenome TaxID=412755 RepID=A0A0F9KYT3_9ZZZZ